MTLIVSILLTLGSMILVQSFAPLPQPSRARNLNDFGRLYAESGVVSQVTGEQLELMMQEWDQPLVIDAYATWCGPCLLMAPEFEAAAKELQGKVRFAKLDTDREETMAARLNIMGLPTLLFLDKYTGPPVEGKEAANAVLKGRLEGAMRKDMIVQLCNHYFFDGPLPDGMA